MCSVQTDIWMHDGVSRASIAEGKVKEFIFGSLNSVQANRCFVSYNPVSKDVSFHYVSGDTYVKLKAGAGCNRSAVFNTVNATWSFDDTPFLFSGALSNPSFDLLTYDTTPATYETIGSTFLELEGGLKKLPVFVGGDAPNSQPASRRLHSGRLW